MDLATGAMNTLLPKLAELVVGEYELQKGVKREIKELEEELTSMTAALRKVAEVPPDQLDEQVKIWASDVRELSYDIEDEVDTFMLRGKELGHTKPFSPKGLICKGTNLIKKAKTNHQIHNVVKDIMDQVKKVAERRDRYKVDNIVISKKFDNIAARPGMVHVDPRLEGMYRKATELVGISGPKNELAKRLLEQDCSSRQQSNIISVVGFGGLGKTTLVNSLLQDLKSKFDCHIFVSVSLNPDINKIFKNILLQLDEKEHSRIDKGWEVKQLIDKIIKFLKNRRCFCVIDDLWKESAWDTLKLAFQDGHPGSKIIITTRNRTVAEHVGGGVYELKPLSDDDSRKLLNKRIFDNETDEGCPPNLREVTGKILKKCGGVPLAIITTASLLASKPMCSVEWEKVNKSIGSGLGNSLDVDKMRKILSLSYNDLPFHLKTCLLSLSKYPEDHLIRKDVVVWGWIAEGFIKQEETQGHAGQSLREIAESYFNDLINRSLIQPEQNIEFSEGDGQVHHCRVHDMVLELINRLSAEEGFVTVLLSEDDQQASTLTSAVPMQKWKIRRLSIINNSIQSYAVSPEASREQLSKVRSLDIFGAVTSIPPLSSFRVLRVLQVDECIGLELQGSHLDGLGKLRHLRFLRLQGLTELPESIGELESLETLDIRGAYNRREILLPVSLGKLGKLVRVLGEKVKLPDGLALDNMESLQELVGILVTMHAVTEIGKLRELKVLALVLKDVPEENFVNLSKLILCPSLQVLSLRAEGITYFLDFIAQVPSGLQRFVSTHSSWYRESFPRWINPSLSCLTFLYLQLRFHVLPEHIEKLAELPSLGILGLDLSYSYRKQEELIVPSRASAFPCLTELRFRCAVKLLKFPQGAMRKLHRLVLQFEASTSRIYDRSPISNNNLEWLWINDRLPHNNLDYGLENLLSLRHVVVRLSEEWPEGQDAIRKAVNDHPNHPSLDIFIDYKNQKGQIRDLFDESR